MKKLPLVLLLFLIISCSSDSPEPETVNQTDDEVVVEDEENEEEEEQPESLFNDLTIYGKTRDSLTGNFDYQLLQYDFSDNEDPNDYINFYSQYNIPVSSSTKFYISSTGISINNEVINSQFYYKSFATENLFQLGNISENLKVLSFGDFDMDIYIFYWEYIEDGESGIYEHSLKLKNSKTLEEKKLKIGDFFPGDFFRLKQSQNILYIYRTRNLYDIMKGSLIVINLDTFEIIDQLENIPSQRFNLVKDDLGNCYFFDNDIIFKYDITSKALNEIEVLGQPLLLSSAFASQEVETIIKDDVMYFGTFGAQPGTQLFNPAIYNLKTGEYEIFDFFQEITKFENDEYEWNPANRAMTFDFENRVFYLGVSSYGLPPQFASNAIFVVDFEGNVLEKRKIPISPIKIIN